MTRKRVPDDYYGRLRRRLDEIARRVDEGSIQFQGTMLGLQRLVEDILKQQIENSCIETVSGGYNLVIPPLDGSRVITGYKRFLENNISQRFFNDEVNDPGPATDEILVDIFQAKRKRGQIHKIAGLLTDHPHKLLLTQDQIMEFIITYRNFMEGKDVRTCFFFESRCRLYATEVSFDDVGRHVFYLENLDSYSIEHFDWPHRFVIPQ